MQLTAVAESRSERLTDAEHVAALAERTVAELERASDPPSPTGAERLRRALTGIWRGVARKTRRLLEEHWDVAAFDVLFGCLKAFGVYPALYFAGLAWAIPVAEYTLLNTQLWTAAYLFARGWLRSQLGRWRYGHPLHRLDELRRRLLVVRSRQAGTLHRFAWGGEQWVLRVGGSRCRAWLRRLTGGEPEPGVVHETQLRAMLSDAEFRYRADSLRGNPYLYEEVLVRKLLATAADRGKLLAVAEPEAPLCKEGVALAGWLDESRAPTRARLLEQADSLAHALRRRAGSCPWPTRRAVRRLHASHRRAIHRALTQLCDLEYRLLAEIQSGGSLEVSRHLDAIAIKRAEIAARVERADRFARRSKGVSSRAQAERLLRSGIGEARVAGLRSGRVRAARWLGRRGVRRSPAPRVGVRAVEATGR